MSERGTMELLNAQLDGRLSVSQRDELDVLLRERPELAEEAAALRRLDALLKQIDAEEPPPWFAARLAGRARLGGSSGWWRQVERRMPRRMLVPLVACAASLLAGILLFRGAPPADEVGDQSPMYGSMLPQSRAAGVLRFDEPALRGSIAIEQGVDGGSWMQVELSAQSVDIKVDFEGSAYRFGGIVPAVADVELTRQGEIVHIRSAGRQRFALQLVRREDADGLDGMAVNIDSGGRVLFGGILAAN